MADDKQTALVYFFKGKKGFTTDQDNQYSYLDVPPYYHETFNFNKKRVDRSIFLQDDTLDTIEENDDFNEIKDIVFEKWGRYTQNSFWYNTFMRMVYIASFAANCEEDRHWLHVESDNIILQPLDCLVRNVQRDTFAFTHEAPFSSAPALMYFDSNVAAKLFLDQLRALLKKGEQALAPFVGYYSSYITDMAFLDIIKRHNKHYTHLPSTPDGANFDKFNMVFDPTSYGQYLFGTNNGHSKGFTDPKHYVGHAINTDRIIVSHDKIIFDTNKSAPIFNLHIHNKKAISRACELYQETK